MCDGRALHQTILAATHLGRVPALPFWLCRARLALGRARPTATPTATPSFMHHSGVCNMWMHVDMVFWGVGGGGGGGG
eukprot:1161680-Pelagomonas_calceolata.AAC.6